MITAWESKAKPLSYLSANKTSPSKLRSEIFLNFFTATNCGQQSYSCPLSPISCPLSHFSCPLSHVSYLTSPVCLMFPVLRLLAGHVCWCVTPYAKKYFYCKSALLVQSLHYSVNSYEWTWFQLLCELNFSLFF